MKREGALPKQQMNEDEYDDSPWTREEIEALAWAAAERCGWDEMADEMPQQPQRNVIQ